MKPGSILKLLGAPALAALLALPASAQSSAERMALPIPPKPFEGTLEPTAKTSSNYVHAGVQAPEGAPNILLVMTDDAGFATSSAFGGAAPTPSLDELAERGLRYNQFHTTAICSPTRAALLTGRNHHAVGLGTLSDIPTPYPGYTGRITPEAATVARILRDNGYSTAMFGKDHNIPQAERSPAGPFDQWPTGRGFDYYYGFIAGDSDQFVPALYEGITPVDDADRPEGYLVDEELADKAINWIHNQKGAAPDKPFFIYYSNGSPHAPQQVPQEWIAKFRGQFDAGWDVLREQILARQIEQGIVPQDTKLAPRPEVVPAWDSLSDQQRKVYARFMEVFAAVMAFQDHQFGRIMDELERMGIADNTLVVFVQGDNGSSAEGGEWGSINEMADLSTGSHGIPLDYLEDNLEVLGGPLTYQGPQSGWAFATDTPFPWFKQIASHLGGIRNGLVISWPEHMKQTGEVREQYHHVIDIMPTLLEAAGVPAPEYVDGIKQMPVHGKSMLYSFDDADAPSVRDTQYYEIMGQRAIYHDGWMANTTPRNMPWNMPVTKGGDTTTYEWELYNLEEDFSQSRNLAAENPEKLAEMRALFDAEARKYNVYPIQDEGGLQRGMSMIMATRKMPRMSYEYWGRDVRLQYGVAPMIFHMPFSIEAQVRVPKGGAEGVIVAAGSHFGGWSFYLEDGKPTAYSSVSGLPLEGAQSKVKAKRALKPGAHTVRYDFKVTGDDGILSISVDGEQVAEGRIAQRPKMIAGNGETFDTGRDSNVAVSPDYEREGVFSGEIDKVTVKLQMPGMGGGNKGGH